MVVMVVAVWYEGRKIINHEEYTSSEGSAERLSVEVSLEMEIGFGRCDGGGGSGADGVCVCV